MADFLKEAVELVKTQAAGKEMTLEQMMDAVRKVQASLITLANIPNEQLLTGIISPTPTQVEAHEPEEDGALGPKVQPDKWRIKPHSPQAKTLIQEDKVYCAICGKEGQQIRPTHFQSHGYTLEEYNRLLGFDPKFKHVATSLSDKRAERMKQTQAARKGNTPEEITTESKPEEAKHGKGHSKTASHKSEI